MENKPFCLAIGSHSKNDEKGWDKGMVEEYWSKISRLEELDWNDLEVDYYLAYPQRTLGIWNSARKGEKT